MLRNKNLIYGAVILLGGAIAILSASPLPTLWQRLLEAVGTGLIATACIGFIELYIAKSKISSHPIVIDLNRYSVGGNIHDKKYRASQICLSGIALKDCMAEISRNQKFADRILFHKVMVEIAFVDPRAVIMQQRHTDDHTDTMGQIMERQYQTVENCVHFYRRLQQGYDNALRESQPPIKPTGHLVIRVIDACPYITLARYDDEIYWGLYLADKPGANSPFFLTKRIDPSHEEYGNTREEIELFQSLCNHFEALMKNTYPSRFNTADKDEGRLVAYGIEGPWLNQVLVKEILPPKRYAALFPDG